MAVGSSGSCALRNRRLSATRGFRQLSPRLHNLCEATTFVRAGMQPRRLRAFRATTELDVLLSEDGTNSLPSSLCGRDSATGLLGPGVFFFQADDNSWELGSKSSPAPFTFPKCDETKLVAIQAGLLPGDRFTSRAIAADWNERLQLCEPRTHEEVERAFGRYNSTWIFWGIQAMSFRTWVRACLITRHRPIFLALPLFLLLCPPILGWGNHCWLTHCYNRAPGPARKLSYFCMRRVELLAALCVPLWSMWVFWPSFVLSFFLLQVRQVLKQLTFIGTVISSILATLLIRTVVRALPLSGGSVLFQTSFFGTFALATAGCFTLTRQGDLQRITSAFLVLLIGQHPDFRAMSLSAFCLLSSCACLSVSTQFVDRRSVSNCARCSCQTFLLSASDLCATCLRVRLQVCRLAVVASVLCLLVSSYPVLNSLS